MTTLPPTPLLGAALWYAARGVRVFPLRPHDKKPLRPGWPDEATTDAATIRAWWTSTPAANIGALMGDPFDVVDLDSADAITDARRRLGGDWPTNLGIVRTPRKNGLHAWIPSTGRPRAIGVLPGVDWLGAGGYVVCAPSVIRWDDDPAHGITAGEGAYRWETTPALDPAAAAAAPWLALWADRDDEAARRTPTPTRAPLTPPRAAGASPWAVRALAEECATVAATAPGARNDALNRAAFKLGQLVPHEVTEADAVAALLDAARACGLTDAEARATLASGLGKGKQHPRQPEERPPAGPLAGLLEPPSGAHSLNTPPEPFHVEPMTGEVLDAGEVLPQVTPEAEGDAPRTRYRFTPGGAFILDAADRPAAWWGDGDAILGAEGEALLIAGPQGTGKSTIGQQLTLGASGFPEYAELLGLPITATRGRVLYLAMDRPRQIARSLRRMVGAAWRDELDARVSVWAGPPPFDLAKHPSVLRQLCEDAGASFVVVDSLKDAFLGLTDDEAAAAWNRARQGALAAGIDVCELHHTRKAGQGKGGTDAPGVDSIYGSTWITSGCGSVVLLTGAPGDPIVGFHHVKQPMSPVGPFKLLHDQDEGRTSVWHAADLVGMAKAKGRLSALDAAGALFETDKPTNAEREKARRKLDALTRAGLLVVVDEGDKAAGRPTRWGAAA